jgi:diketogulonate reductase-like aldo/keto reductase
MNEETKHQERSPKRTSGIFGKKYLTEKFMKRFSPRPKGRLPVVKKGPYNENGQEVYSTYGDSEDDDEQENAMTSFSDTTIVEEDKYKNARNSLSGSGLAIQTDLVNSASVSSREPILDSNATKSAPLGNVNIATEYKTTEDMNEPMPKRKHFIGFTADQDIDTPGMNDHMKLNIQYNAMLKAIMQGARVLHAGSNMNYFRGVSLAIARSGIKREKFFIIVGNVPGASVTKIVMTLFGCPEELVGKDGNYIDLFVLNVSNEDSFMDEFVHHKSLGTKMFQTLGASGVNLEILENLKVYTANDPNPPIIEVSTNIYKQENEIISKLKEYGWVTISRDTFRFSSDEENEIIITSLASKYKVSYKKMLISYAVARGINPLFFDTNTERLIEFFQTDLVQLSREDFDSLSSVNM